MSGGGTGVWKGDRFVCSRFRRRLVALTHANAASISAASAMLLCLQVAAAQVLKEASKPVRVAESDVDVSETDTRTWTGGEVPVRERPLSPPAGQAEPLV